MSECEDRRNMNFEICNRNLEVLEEGRGGMIIGCVKGDGMEPVWDRECHTFVGV